MNSRTAGISLTEALTSGHRAGTNRNATRIAWSLCIVSVTMSLASLLLAVLNGRSLGEIILEETTVTIAILSVAFSTVGAFIASRRPHNPIGWLFSVAALCQAAIVFGEEYGAYALVTRPSSLPLGAEMSWLKEWIWSPGLGLILVYLPLLFPDGRLPGRRWWWVAALGGFSIVLISVLYMVALWPERGIGLIQPGGEAEASIAPGMVRVTEMIAFPMMLMAGAAAVISLFTRFRLARGDERQQIKWFAAASALSLAFALVFQVVGTADGGTLAIILVVASVFVVPSIPVATGIAILRHRLYDIDVIINRTLVYAALTACVAGIYIFIVGYLGSLLRAGGNLWLSLAATGAVAVAFAPLRERLQRAVDRLMYGDRDDPYGVLAGLGQRLQQTIAPAEVLPTIVETVAGALRLPYAAIALRDGDGYETVAEHGDPQGGAPLVVPLAYGGDEIGRLILAPRAPGESFGPADERLIVDVAHQAGVAIHAVRLTSDLRRSRIRLVTTREEERRRLRRDLHDGLGPSLATLTLQLDAARNLMRRDPDAARQLLGQMKLDTQSAIAEIRRLVHELRPPALDQLGLVPAIREQATAFSQQNLTISVDAPDAMAPLPAAVEVAAYRIAQEALTNVVRHARARRCGVRISVADELVLDVTDDGIGLPADPRGGVGLASMRERATELGGSLVAASSSPAGGTRIIARLPLVSPGGRA